MRGRMVGGGGYDNWLLGSSIKCSVTDIKGLVLTNYFLIFLSFTSWDPFTLKGIIGRLKCGQNEQTALIIGCPKLFASI